MRESERAAREIRENVLRMTHSGGSSHVASGLSCADILAVLYHQVMQVDAARPEWDERDRFIMSKGHAGAAVYAALAGKGYFDPARLNDHYRNGSLLSGHVSHVGIPGVEVSTGSLGHGLGIAAGMAWQARRWNADWRTFVLLSDGECDEGSTWEAALFAAHHKLSNLVAVVDYNRLQSLATTEETLALEPFADKWRSFGWAVAAIDGHDHCALAHALATPRGADPGRPVCVLAHTVKGKGVGFMENQVLWHYRSPSSGELSAALSDLTGTK